jgi:hypothetical protein
MSIREFWVYFIGSLFSFLLFFVEVARSLYLIPVLFGYGFLVYLVLKFVYKIFLKLGYVPKKEVNDTRRTVISIILFVVVVFLGTYIFILGFYWVCQTAHIMITSELEFIKQNLLKFVPFGK